MFLSVDKVKDVLSKGFDINSWISDRSGRKSSTIQDYLIQEALDDRPFVLLRNKKDEEITENWLSDYILEKYSDYVFYSEKINSNIVALKFRAPNNENYLLCYGLYVSLQQKYKSSYYEGFEKVKYIVWEECIPNQPLLQNIKHIRARCMTEIYNVLSIASTIARDRQIQHIWLGNDIKMNILNPVTIGFNVLERLDINTPIIDKAVFNDKEYSFYFEYFDFENSVNHWLYNESLHITRELSNTENIIKYNILIKSEFKTYYIYNCGSYVHISDIDYIGSKTINNEIRTELDFFKKFNAERIYLNYSLRTALTILCTFQGVPNRIIAKYFGPEWVKGKIEFNPIIEEISDTVINIEEIIDMNLSDIMNLPEYSEIYNLNELKKVNTMTFSNIKIQLLIEELSNIFLFV